MHRVEIERLAYGGDAVAHLEDGRVAFVSGGCPGDTADVEIVQDKGRYVHATIASLIETSPDRVTPPCPYFGRCGGCQWQHIAYSAQTRAKRAFVVDALSRIARVADAEDITADTLTSGREYGYRNKMEFEVRAGAKNLHLGLHAMGSDELIDIDACLLLSPRSRKAPKALRGALRYLSGTTDLGVHRVAVRTGERTKDLEVAVWTHPSAFPRAAAARVIGQALAPSSLVRVLYKGDIKERASTKVEVLAGRGMFTEQLGEYLYAISAPSFFQTNTRVAETLVASALETLALDGTDRVLDLYAGAGTFTLPLAEAAGEVVAVESWGPAVRDLRRNLESNMLHAEVLGGDAARELPSLGTFDAVVVDPPRSGMGTRALEALIHSRPRRIAYVSCDPSTLARDAGVLIESGYRLCSALPVDMFPQTYHVETLAFFQRA